MLFSIKLLTAVLSLTGTALTVTALPALSAADLAKTIKPDSLLVKRAAKGADFTCASDTSFWMGGAEIACPAGTVCQAVSSGSPCVVGEATGGNDGGVEEEPEVEEEEPEVEEEEETTEEEETEEEEEEECEE